VDEDGDGAGVHGAEAHDAAVRGELEQKARCEQHEQHRRDHNGAPVRHLDLFLRREGRKERERGRRKIMAVQLVHVAF
jgi:hypothetical protein